MIPENYRIKKLTKLFEKPDKCVESDFEFDGIYALL